MAVIIRRAKPITIKRRFKEPHRGAWPGALGYPPAADRIGYHAIRHRRSKELFVLTWHPETSMGPTWTCGFWSCSPGVMSEHDYIGEVSVVYRSSSCVPSDFYNPGNRRKWK